MKYLSVPILWQILSKVFLISLARYHILQKQCFQLSLVKECPISRSDFATFEEKQRTKRRKFHATICREAERKVETAVLSIAERRERKYERKINDPASTLIIPIHKAWYPDTSATSGLIKNDDREGRKLQAAYRPINSTSARPATVSSPRLPLPSFFPLPSRLVFKHRRCKKKTCVIIANFQLNFPLTTIYDRINRLPGRQTPPIVFTSLLISPRVHDTFVILFPFFFFRFNLTDIIENFTRRIYHNVTKETKLSLLFFFFFWEDEDSRQVKGTCLWLK